MTTPTNPRTHDLTQFAQNLASQRDQHIAAAERSVSQGAVEFNVGFASAMRLALVYLHIQTGGEYGAPGDEQPDPYTVPIAGAAAEHTEEDPRASSTS